MFLKLFQRRYFSSNSNRNITKAVICESLSKPLVYKDYDLGPLPSGSVKIEVAAAGINFGDILQCQGKYQEKAEPPFIPGFECSGTIVEIDSNVKSNGKLQVGDRVVCTGQRAFSKHLYAPASNVVPLPRNLPDNIDLAEAAALLVSYGTAHLALTSQGRLKSGETVLITAAAGGVGLACVELARFTNFYFIIFIYYLYIYLLSLYLFIIFIIIIFIIPIIFLISIQ